jgi:molybdopterin-containing oxidoreductase family iron-sulfur binding subunit
MNERPDIEALRARLDGTRGREYWRSLEALTGTPEFQEFLHREFPQNASEWLDPVGRRGFMKLMSASLALAGVSACTRQPAEELVPYVRQPEEIVPGKPLFYATAMPMNGAGMALLVESHEGRPTKIEGNPDHPSSGGATDLFAQASVLGLYDPDRSQTLTHLGEIRTFAAFTTQAKEILAAQKAKQGAGFRLLTETIASPTLAAQIRELLDAYPQAKWVQFEPFSPDNAREGSRQAFGEYVAPQYAVDKADLLVTIDADLLCTGAAGIRHARAFASRRRIDGDASKQNRLYAIESSPTNTGTKADHRLLLKPTQIEVAVRALAAQLGVLSTSESLPAATQTWVEALAKDLQAARGRSLVVAGDGQTVGVHATVHAINQALGNVGTTVVYTATPEAQPSNQLASLRELVGEMRAGTVEFLLIMGVNPVYTAPADLKFADAMDKVAVRAHLGLYEDETAALCHWHIPEAHYLEAWGDVRSDDGTVTIVQPLIAPLYNGKSAHEVIAAIGPSGERPGYDIVREYWMGQGSVTGVPAPASQSGSAPVAPVAPTAPPAAAAPAGAATGQATPAASGLATFSPAPAPSAFDTAWRKWLHDGMIANTAFTPKTVTAGSVAATPGPRVGEGIEVVFRPDPSVWDGRFANNAWLQELPKSLTKLTWDNAALMSVHTADALKVVSGDMIEIRKGERSLTIPAWINPGHADDTITLHLGYGRTRAGRVANEIGFNVNVLRLADTPDVLTGVEVAKSRGSYDLACTQDHWTLAGRNLVRVATTEQYTKDPGFAHEREETELTGANMLPMYKYEGYAWGMSIDQNVCTGCNACVVACVAENNIAVVGKAQVLNGREMHWLRIDRYYTGNIDNPDTYHQPMLCQQCETAPCEVVCPVAATSHSSEGLNDMVYNRCVGTRYCSNNCPYKVRRFNFLLYSDWDTESTKLQRNPDVTVRSRGVMEKCTYCTQRISLARINAKLEDRQIRDGEIVTACQAACPTDAIVFGNINDPNSRVTQLKKNPLTYGLLEELNTKPRTTYLAVVRNPNTALEPAAPARTEGEA